MLSLSLAIGVLGTAACLCFVVAAAVRFRRREYAGARKVAGFATLTTCLSVPLATVAAVVSAFTSYDDESVSKATVLARGISSGMNASLPALICGLVAFVFWSACVYRARREAERRSS